MTSAKRKILLASIGTSPGVLRCEQIRVLFASDERARGCVSTPAPRPHPAFRAYSSATTVIRGSSSVTISVGSFGL